MIFYRKMYDKQYLCLLTQRFYFSDALFEVQSINQQVDLMKLYFQRFAKQIYLSLPF